MRTEVARVFGSVHAGSCPSPPRSADRLFTPLTILRGIAGSVSVFWNVCVHVKVEFSGAFTQKVYKAKQKPYL